MEKPRKPPLNLLSLDWEGILDQLKKVNPNDGNFYLIVVNKGQGDNELRSRFLNHKEAIELVMTAIEKKKRGLPVTL